MLPSSQGFWKSKSESLAERLASSKRSAHVIVIFYYYIPVLYLTEILPYSLVQLQFSSFACSSEPVFSIRIPCLTLNDIVSLTCTSFMNVKRKSQHIMSYLKGAHRAILLFILC